VGTLDGVNSKEYVRMLRRAMDQLGFQQVVFTYRTPLVWKLAGHVPSVSVFAGVEQGFCGDGHPARVL
jgi:hypothetical protein